MLMLWPVDACVANILGGKKQNNFKCDLTRNSKFENNYDNEFLPQISI